MKRLGILGHVLLSACGPSRQAGPASGSPAQLPHSVSTGQPSPILSLTATPSSTSTGKSTRAWNPALEFRILADRANPSPDLSGRPDVWRYLFSDVPVHDPGHYHLLPHYSDIGNRQQWDSGDSHGTTNPPTPEVGMELGQRDMILHPFIDQFAVIGWTSPIDGPVTVTGSVGLPPTTACPSGTGILWSVDQGDRPLVSGALPAGGDTVFTASTTVRAGETLYFVDDPGADTNCDTTFVNLSITTPGAAPTFVTVTRWYPGNPTGDLWDIARGAGLTLSQLLALPLNAQFRSHPSLVYAGNQVQVR